jgi:LPS-assembly protein
VIRRLFFIPLLAVCAISVRAQAQRPEIITNPDSVVSVDQRTGETVVTNGAKIMLGDMLLTSDELRYNLLTNQATATGHVTFTQGKRRLLADKLTYNLRDGTYTAESMRFGDYPLYGTGESATGNKEQITLDRATVSLREPGPWQPTLSAKQIIYGPGDQVRADAAQVGVGGTRPLPFPQFKHRVNEPLLPYVRLAAGFRRSLGAFADAGIAIPVNERLKLGGDVGYYTERGLMAGPAAQYNSIRGERDLRGHFRSGYINDHGDKLTDVLGRPVGESRAFAEWEHQQQINERLTLTGQLNYWKDSAIVRDFRPDAFFNVQEPDTFLESVYTGDNYFVSAFARFQPNSFQAVQERLPEIRFDLLPFAIGNGFYQQFNASAVRLREDPPLGGTPLRSDRLDAYYALIRPFAPSDWFSFTPVAGGRVTHYANTRGATSPGTYTRVLGEVGFDPALRGSATFDYQNPVWKINGLRHLVTPRVSYRYIPNADRGSRYIPTIDRRQAFTTYLPTLGLGATRNIDDLSPTNLLRVGVDNVLQTRDANYGSRDLLILNIAGDFRFKRDPGVREFSELHTETILMPTHWLQFDAYTSYSLHSSSFREFNSGLTIHDGEAWSLRFSNNFLRGEIEDYHLEGRVRLNEIFEARGRLHYDARKRRFNQQSYGISQNLGNIWRVSYVASFYSGRQRESNFGFNVQFETLGF